MLQQQVLYFLISELYLSEVLSLIELIKGRSCPDVTSLVGYIGKQWIIRILCVFASESVTPIGGHPPPTTHRWYQSDILAHQQRNKFIDLRGIN